MEAEVASLKAQTEANGRDLRDIWERLQKTTAADSKLELILYRLDELTKALDRHDLAETERHAAHEGRISALEKARLEHEAERKGAWRVIAAQGAAVGAIVSAGVTALAEHFLAGGK